MRRISLFRIFLLIVFLQLISLINGQGDGEDTTPEGGGDATEPSGGDGGNAQCGVQRGAIRTRFRVVGGGRARTGNYPWQVMILRNQVPVCGGAVIGPTSVLTAAHCIPGGIYQQYRIVAGTHGRFNQDRWATAHRITKVARHPQFNIRLLTANVAVVTIAPAFNFQRGRQGVGHISPICLLSKKAVIYVNTPAIISGFGWSRVGAADPYLKAARVTVLDHAYCERAYRGVFYYDRRSMLCAGNIYGGADACFGDGGGPLSIEVANRVTEIGIVSHGYGCGRPGFPRIYTKVSTVRNWIVAQMKPADVRFQKNNENMKSWTTTAQSKRWTTTKKTYRTTNTSSQVVSVKEKFMTTITTNVATTSKPNTATTINIKTQIAKVTSKVLILTTAKSNFHATTITVKPETKKVTAKVLTTAKVKFKNTTKQALTKRATI